MLLEAARVDDGDCMYRPANADAVMYMPDSCTDQARSAGLT